MLKRKGIVGALYLYCVHIFLFLGFRESKSLIPFRILKAVCLDLCGFYYSFIFGLGSKRLLVIGVNIDGFMDSRECIKHHTP